MFIFNLFVGIVIENFKRMKDKLCGYILMTDEQRNWVEMQRFMIRRQLKPQEEIPKSFLRKLCYEIVNHNFTEVVITVCIFLNTIVMAMRYYRMSSEYADSLEICNYIFAVIFNVECLIKLIAMGKFYFYGAWNK